MFYARGLRVNSDLLAARALLKSDTVGNPFGQMVVAESRLHARARRRHAHFPDIERYNDNDNNNNNNNNTRRRNTDFEKKINKFSYFFFFLRAQFFHSDRPQI